MGSHHCKQCHTQCRDCGRKLICILAVSSIVMASNRNFQSEFSETHPQILHGQKEMRTDLSFQKADSGKKTPLGHSACISSTNFEGVTMTLFSPRHSIYPVPPPHCTASGVNGYRVPCAIYLPLFNTHVETRADVKPRLATGLTTKNTNA